MTEESNVMSLESIKQRGGKRPGAGRKRLDFDARTWMARGIEPLYAAEVLASVANERATWKRLLESPDDRIVLDAMKFLMAMRDGKPAQSVNLTSTSINISSSDINKARAIVAEIRNSFAVPSLGTGDTDSRCSLSDRVTGQVVENTGLMLSGDEAPKKDG